MSDKEAPLLVTIVLAAGESRRMGEPKLFLEAGEGTMLLMAVRAAQSLGHPVVIVTGAYPQKVREHLAEINDLTFAHNPDWRKGMSGSIAAGVRKARAFNPQGYFITLADQPSMGAESLAFITDPFYENPGKIVATWYPERLGVPAIFPTSFTDELLSNTGKSGARALIEAAGDEVHVIRFHQPPPDIDTPEDYRRWLNGKFGQ